MTPTSIRLHPATSWAIAALSFIAACVAHEALGHAGACLLLGGRIQLLSSVYFRSQGGGSLTDVGGVIANLLLAGFMTIALWRGPSSPGLRVFLRWGIAFNVFWVAGCALLSAVKGTGDIGFALMGWGLPPSPAVRAVLVAVVVLLYGLGLRVLRSGDERPSSLIPFLASLLWACVSVCAFRGPFLPALKEAVLEGGVAQLGFLWLGLRRAKEASMDAPSAVAWRWVLTAAVVVPLFIATLGRGLAG